MTIGTTPRIDKTMIANSPPPQSRRASGLGKSEWFTATSRRFYVHLAFIFCVVVGVIPPRQGNKIVLNCFLSDYFFVREDKHSEDRHLSERPG